MLSFFTQYQSLIKFDCQELKKLNLQVFIFDSALNSLTPQDIDLLIVYPPALSPRDQLSSQKIVNNLKSKSINQIPYHLTILTWLEFTDPGPILTQIKNQALRIF